MTRTRAVARLAVGGVFAFLAAWLISAPVAAASAPTFGQPTVTGAFGEPLVASQPVTLTAVPDRVEVLVTMADTFAPLVSDVPPPFAIGPTTLRHTIEPADGHILPNTPVSVRWRITSDGITTLGPATTHVVADERFDWQTVSGDLVRVHWYKGDRAFGERALGIGERAVTETSKLLGVTETKPIDFFIYADQGAFYDALGPGTRDNVGGQANAEIRTLFARIEPASIDDAWVENVVPHELTHLVFDTAVKNPYHFPPRWLNEGLAVYLSVGYDAGDRSAVQAAARTGGLVPLDGLVGQFPTSASGFSLAYSESASAVDYLVRTKGRDTLVSLVRSYADGRTDDEAFDAATGMDVAAFNDAWLADIGAKPPLRYGPQPAPGGPVPEGWSGPSSAPGSGASPVPGAATGAPIVTAAPSAGPSDGLVESGGVTPHPLLLFTAALIVIGIALLVLARTQGPSVGPRP
jgi:Peptidase MA superfamily